MNPILLYSSVFGFLVGVALASVYSISTPILLFIMLLALGIILPSVFDRVLGRVKEQQKFVLVLSIFLVTFTVGVFRFDMFDTRGDIDSLSNEVGEEIVLRGLVDSEVEARDDFQWATLKPSEFQNEDKVYSILNMYNILYTEENNFRVRVALQHFPEVRYGDKIEVQGKLALPENFETDLGRTFDYKNFLAKDDIKYLMWYPEVQVLESSGGNLVVRNLFLLKQLFKEKIDKVVPEPHASLANGILLGSKQGLGEYWSDAFRDTGIVHIVVLSGFNITIVALFVMWLFSALPFRVARFSALVSIVLFAILVGAGATVVRASIMAGLAIFAPVIHRKYSIHRSLAFACVAMVLINPYVLMFDPSFQLSFMATLGLVYLSPVISRHLWFVTEKWKIHEIVVATISTQIFVLPLLLYMIGTVSTVALPVNLLVLPVIPLGMLVAFLTGITGFVSLTLSTLVSYPSYVVLDYVFKVVEVFASVPYATLSTPEFPAWIVFVVYFVSALYLYRWWKRNDTEPLLFERFDNVFDPVPTPIHEYTKNKDKNIFNVSRERDNF